MKRMIVLLIACSLIFLISSCDNNYSEYHLTENKLFEINVEKTSYISKVKEIKVTITKKSEKDISYGDSDFKLIKFENNKWMELNYKNGVVLEEIIWNYPDTESVNETFSINKYYKLPLKSGNYKIAILGIGESNEFLIE